MMIFALLLVSLALLPVPLDLIALNFNEMGTWKFVLNMFTHQLGHANLPHLVGNYMFMLPYAIYLEARLGRMNFLAFYFLTGFLAAFSQVLGAHSSAMIGSSGAAFGVFAGACALFDRSLWQRVTGFLLLGFALMIQFMYATDIMNVLFGGIAYWAHFGGGTAGLALVHFFVKPYMLQLSSPQSKSESCRKPTSKSS